MVISLSLNRHLWRNTITEKTRHKWKNRILSPEESRDVVREPLRLPQRRLISKQPPPSAEQEEGMESKSKRARVNVSELLHDAFLSQKLLDPKRSNGEA